MVHYSLKKKVFERDGRTMFMNADMWRTKVTNWKRPRNEINQNRGDADAAGLGNIKERTWNR